MLNISKDMSDEDIELLKTTPASYLGSCRFKLPDDLNNNIYNIGCWLFIEYPSSLTSLISIVSSLTSTLLSFLTAP